MATTKKAGAKGAGRTRFVKGTDTPVIRVMDGKRRFFWATVDGDADGGKSYRRVELSDTELR